MRLRDLISDDELISVINRPLKSVTEEHLEKYCHGNNSLLNKLVDAGIATSQVSLITTVYAIIDQALDDKYPDRDVLQ